MMHQNCHYFTITNQLNLAGGWRWMGKWNGDGRWKVHGRGEGGWDRIEGRWIVDGDR